MAVDFVSDFLELLLERRSFGVELRELAGQHDAQLLAHFVAQLGVALGLEAWRFSEFICRVTSSKMSLMRARLSLASSRRASASRLRDLYLVMPAASSMMARRSVGLAAQDLPDAALLDDGVGLGPEAGAHEDVLNVAQAAELAVQQILAFAGAEQAARDRDLARLEGRA